MKIKDSISRKLFIWINNFLLLMLALVCIMPMIHIFAVSLSSRAAAAAGFVKFLPVDFTLISYEYVLNRAAFWLSFVRTLHRVAIGVPINLFMTVMVAYPLSKEKEKFHARTVYVWISFFTALFSGGFIPSYILIKDLGLIDSIWALVLPGAVPVFNVILMLNFFRSTVPGELEDAALIDGAGHFRTLFSIYIPCALPSIATITLFSIVGHWNSYFDGMIYSKFVTSYPLQTYLRTMVIARDFSADTEDLRLISLISERTMKAAQIFIGALPILAVYPFLQKFFIKGIVIGSVKG